MGKILLFTQNFPPEAGPVLYNYNITKALKRKGHDITVITGIPHYPNSYPHPGYSKYKPVTKIEEGVKIIRVPMIMASNNQPLKRIFGLLTYMLSAMIATLFVGKQDVIMASSPQPSVVPPAYFAKLIKRARLIFTLRDVEPFNYFRLHGVHEKFPFNTIIKITNWFYNRANHIVLTHDTYRASTIPYGCKESKILTIQHCVDFTDFDLAAKERDTLVLPQKENNIKLVYVGTLGKIHGVDKVLEMFAAERIKSLPITLYFVGDGELTNKVNEIIESKNLKNVVKYSAIHVSKVPSVLNQADVLLLTLEAKKELVPGVSSKFYEYLASGKPVLINQPSNAADDIEKLGCGFTFQSYDEESLYSTLQDIISKREELPQIGLKGREHIKNNFSIEIFGDKYEKILF